MKKLLSLFLAFIMVVSVFSAVPFTVFAKETDTATVSLTCGDYSYYIETIDEDRLICADTDKDSKITILDATQIQCFIAQLIPEL